MPGQRATIGLVILFGVSALTACNRPLQRQDLVHLMDRYLAALVTHDPSSVPLAEDVKLVENTEVTPIGQGLWKTATGGPTDFRIYVPDPDAGQVAFLGVIEDNHIPTILGARLKLDSGKITEIDHLVVHPRGDTLNPNMSNVRPAFHEPVAPSERVSRDRMLQIANSYYDAIIQDDGDVAPFADDCQRRENGAISVNDQTITPDEAARDDFAVFRRMKCGEQLSTGIMSYITDINSRRFIAVDQEMGLVFAYSIFRHEGVPEMMTIKGVPGIAERPNTFGPFDLPAAHVFKIWGGQIHEIEAIGYRAEHGVPSGWE